MPDYKWKRIAPLSEPEREIDLAAIVPLYESWKLARGRLADSSPASLQRFTEKLIRRLSVETGILERLYDLDRGTTEALVQNGFVEDLVSHASTDIEPSSLIDFLQDQEAAVQLVIDCITGKRELTKNVIHELHSILTRHQETTTAINQFGTRMEIRLAKGEFKEQPNNPKRPDGSIHEYCPPIHVESEMENLLNWLKDYRDEDPVIVSAWLHHRFTQIHPYQDGNGRVARLLTTLVLLQADLLPLVIDRDLRTEYLDSLEKADSGDLAELASLFARLERTAILEALSVDIDAEIAQEETLTSAVIHSLAAKFNKRKTIAHAELRNVNGVAENLRVHAREAIQVAFNELREPISYIADPEIHIIDGGPDHDNAHWYKHDVAVTGNKSGKFVNFNEAHYFVKATIRVAQDRLVFVTSFHHVGRELAGIMEATAFARLEAFDGSDDRQFVSQDFFHCSMEPFVFTYRTDPDQIRMSFARWIDTALAIAIKEYGDRL